LDVAVSPGLRAVPELQPAEVTPAPGDGRSGIVFVSVTPSDRPADAGNKKTPAEAGVVG
jgi:hypothetical protein